MRFDGKVARSHGIAAEESNWLLHGVVIDDTGLFPRVSLRDWGDIYAVNRPMAVSEARPTMRALDRKPKAQCRRPSSVAHLSARSRLSLVVSPYSPGDRVGTPQAAKQTPRGLMTDQFDESEGLEDGGIAIGRL